MPSYRRSYWKTIIAVTTGATGALLVLWLSARLIVSGDAVGWPRLLGLLLAAVAVVMLAWGALVLVGGFLSLHRDTLEARGVSYASRRPRERTLGLLRRWARTLVPASSGVRRDRPLCGVEHGDEVEVRRLEEILATLDERGTLDGLPFMPEMIGFCGKRFRVYRRVDKLNDWVDHTGLRRVRNTVLLEGLHCDGSAHDGCQARCHIRWNEAWLKRPGDAQATDRDAPAVVASPPRRRDLDLMQCTRRVAADGSERYVCQVTELGKGTTPLRPADPRHYLRDLWRGNIGLWPLLEGVSIAAFNWVQRKRKGVPFPAIMPAAAGATPDVRLGLVPGELVHVRTKREIEPTLNASYRNRGLWFDGEMLRFCGGQYRVLSRVTKLIEERSGKMITLSNPCIILEGVTASAEYQAFGAQNETIFWREAWLARAGDETPSAAPRHVVNAVTGALG
jgi:hypothetical protein